MTPAGLRAALVALLAADLSDEDLAALVTIGTLPVASLAPRAQAGAKVRSAAYLERQAERARGRRAARRGADAGADAMGPTGPTQGADAGPTLAPQAVGTRASDLQICSASADLQISGAQPQTPLRLPSVASPQGPTRGRRTGADAPADRASGRPSPSPPPKGAQLDEETQARRAAIAAGIEAAMVASAKGLATEPRTPEAPEGAAAPRQLPQERPAATGRPDVTTRLADAATGLQAPPAALVASEPVEAPSGPATGLLEPTPAGGPPRPRKRATPPLRLVPSGPAPEPAKRVAPRTRCPTSDDPNAPAWLAAHGLPALDDPEHGAEVTACLDHHGARANTMADWKAAWRTWQRNAAAFAARRAGPGLIGANGLPMSPTNRIDRWGKVRQIEPLLPRDENGVRLLPSGKPEQRLEALPPHLCVGVNENRLAL